MKFLLIITALIVHYNAFTQRDEWHVKAGENVRDVLGDSIIYKYQQFTEGIVYFKDGTTSHGNLNLSIFNGEMQFIKPSGDTLALANAGLVNFITIQNDTFYYSKVFVQSLYGNAVAKLGKIEVIRQVDLKKKGAYGQLTSTSSISSISSFYDNNNQFAKLSEATEVVLHKATYYLIGDRFSNFKPAIKKNILNMFNANKTAIETFMNNNKINLTKKEDLIKLVDFIQQTQQ